MKNKRHNINYNKKKLFDFRNHEKNFIRFYMRIEYDHRNKVRIW